MLWANIHSATIVCSAHTWASPRPSHPRSSRPHPQPCQAAIASSWGHGCLLGASACPRPSPPQGVTETSSSPVKPCKVPPCFTRNSKWLLRPPLPPNPPRPPAAGASCAPDMPEAPRTGRTRSRSAWHGHQRHARLLFLRLRHARLTWSTLPPGATGTGHTPPARPGPALCRASGITNKRELAEGQTDTSFRSSRSALVRHGTLNVRSRD